MDVTHSFDESIIGASDEEDVSVVGAMPVQQGGQPAQHRPGRGRPRRTGAAVVLGLSPEDLNRVETQRAEMIANTKTRIEGLNLEESHRLLNVCLTRDPSMMFDLLDSADDRPTVPPVPGQPNWCVCQSCSEMPTVLERKCCGQPPDTCISRLPEMDVYIVQPGALRLARRIWNDVRAQVDPVEVGESNKQFRFAAYRQFIVWQYGALGRGHRIVIPSCCVWKIRTCYPDQHGQYKGFVPARV